MAKRVKRKKIPAAEIDAFLSIAAEKILRGHRTAAKDRLNNPGKFLRKGATIEQKYELGNLARSMIQSIKVIRAARTAGHLNNAILSAFTAGQISVRMGCDED